MYASKDLKIASRWLQGGLFEPIWPNLGSRWLQDGSKLAQVGPMLDQVGSKLAQVGPKIGSMSIQEASWRVLDGSREAPGGSQEPRGAPGGPRGTKIASKSVQQDQNFPKKLQILFHMHQKYVRSSKPLSLQGSKVLSLEASEPPIQNNSKLTPISSKNMSGHPSL